MAIVGLGLGLMVARHTHQTAPPPLPPPPPTVPSLFNFRVPQKQPLLVTPNRLTPTQRLYLNNIDDQLGLRSHVNILLFYPSRRQSSMNSEKKNEDPADIIREAMGKVLVPYYPFAGRLRDADNGKLIVDCTGEGILFVEADADISLEDLGDLSPPIPRAFDFINNVPGSDTITNTPILLFQVTRLRCGGFILGLRYNHCVTDAVGIAAYVKALAEISRGAANPTVPPVWEREILRPRANLGVKHTCVSEYYEFEKEYLKSMVAPMHAMEKMSMKSFYFSSKEIETLKQQVEDVKFCTPFDVISACLWQSRTKALNIPGDQEVALMFPLNARSRFRPRLPAGYYGNAIASAYAKTRARDLMEKPLSFATKLINEGKRRVNEEYMRSMVDLAELNGHPLNLSNGSFIISDISKLVLASAQADFGWGKPVYACPVFSPIPNFSYLLRPSVKDSGGIVVPVSLPSSAMEIFEENINNAINNGRQR